MRTSILLLAVGLGCTPAPKGKATTSPGATAPGASVCFDGEGAHCLTVIPGPPRQPAYRYEGRFEPPTQWIDRERVDEGRKVAPSFALKELYNPSKEGRYVTLSPSAVAALQRVRDAWHRQTGAGLVVTSGFRSPQRNRAVGGVVGSRHTYGDAFDFKPTGGRWDVATRNRMKAVCKAQGFNEVVTYDPAKSGHIHCAMDPGQAWRDGKVGFDAWIVKAANGAWRAEWAGIDNEGTPAVMWRALGPGGTPPTEAEGVAFTPPPGTLKLQMTVGDAAFCEAPITATGRTPCETNAKAE